MITNSNITIYHLSGLDLSTHNELWTRYNYNNVWTFGGQGAGINKGYDKANDLDIRIPYGQNNNLDIENFSIGDIVVTSALDIDITTPLDLNGYLVYNITSINNNNFGHNQHIHLGAK